MSPEDILFGKIAIHFKLLTQAQVSQCMQIQAADPMPRSLGDICLSQGYLRKEHVEHILKAQAQMAAKNQQKQGGAPGQAAGNPAAGRQPAAPQQQPAAAQQQPAAAQQKPAAPRVAGSARKDHLSAAASASGAAQQLKERTFGLGNQVLERARRIGLKGVGESERIKTPMGGHDGRQQPDTTAPSGQAGGNNEPNQPAAESQIQKATRKPTLRPETEPPMPLSGEPLPTQQQGLINELLRQAVSLGASDLHIHAGSRVVMRVNGQLRPLNARETLDAARTEAAIAEIIGPKNWPMFKEEKDFDFAYSIPNVGRFRVNAYRQMHGYDIVFRVLPSKTPTLAALGLPETLLRGTEFRTGIVLCTGPIGCGKSSTLAALVDIVSQHRAEHIITVEDPIEFLYSGGKSLINQRQVGDHTASFARALKGALREDPDVIAITELRDRDTISLALTAAETGHLVLGSLHTGSAIQTITRIVNAFPAKQQAQVRVMLSESLKMVISQRLVAKKDGTGRVPVVEILIVTTAIANMIREDKAFQIESQMQRGKRFGMVLMDVALRDLVKSGTIHVSEAQKHAVYPHNFEGMTADAPAASLPPLPELG